MILKYAGTLAGILALCACGQSQPESFSVKGTIGGNSDRFTPHTSCTFADATIAVGDPLILKGANGNILGKANLEESYIESPGPACQLKFTFPKVKSGETAYTLTVDGYDPAVVTEDELRSDELTISARSSFERLTGDQPLTVRDSFVTSSTS